MNDKGPNQSAASQRFWDAFKACVEENRVRPERSSFYVKWVQAFVNFLPEKRLRDRSRRDIEAFLAETGKQPGIASWQTAQAEHALKILYETFLPGYMPHVEVKPGPEKSENKALVPGRKGKRGVFRDRGIPGEAERLFSPLLDDLKSDSSPFQDRWLSRYPYHWSNAGIRDTPPHIRRSVNTGCLYPSIISRTL